MLTRLERGFVHFKGGGGGSSGKVEYPGYIETVHKDWLDNTGADTVASSMTDLLNAGFGNSPFAAAVAFDPDTHITAMEGELTTFNDLVDLLSVGTGLDTLVQTILDDARIDDLVDEYAADLDAQLAADVYPRFEAGMRDINAVMSSAFVIGRSVIEDGRNRQVAGFSAAIHVKAGLDDALKLVALKLQYQHNLTVMTAEVRRVATDMKVMEDGVTMDYEEKDARWDIGLYQHASNLMASPAGGTSVPPDLKGPSKTQAALGGAMAGAAVGAMVGGPAGAGIGLAVGGIAGYFLG